MPVIGIDQVPREIVRPKLSSDIGYASGALLRALLLQQMQQGGGFGQVPTQPTPGNPGQLTFPSGATTPTSPLELAQIQQIRGVPTRQGSITPLGQTSQGGVQFTQPTRLGIRPDLNYQLQQAQLQKSQQDLDPNSPTNVMNRAIAGYYTGNTPKQESGKGDFEMSAWQDAAKNDGSPESEAAQAYLRIKGLL